MAAVTFYGILWLEGANDVIAEHFDISLYTTTEIARYAIFIGPVVAYWVTKRICLGLQRKDADRWSTAYETGIIRHDCPEGEFIEVHQAAAGGGAGGPAVPGSTPWPRCPPPRTGTRTCRDPATRGVLGKLRLRAARVITESVPLDEAATGTATVTGTATTGTGTASRPR